MFLFLLSLAVIWASGPLFGVPARLRWLLVGLLYLAIVLAHLVLPDGHAIRAATGQEVAPWLLLGGAAVIVMIYRTWLNWMRKNARGEEPAPAPKPTFSPAELDRYARHIVLRELGGPGQKKLKQARVLVIGAGGLGAPALQYLAAAGVGTIGIVDDDVVDNANLQRQVIHRDDGIGMLKVASAAEALLAQNPYVSIEQHPVRITADNADALIKRYDLVLDGSDNFETRYLVNRVAIERQVPLVSGALSQWEGQISLFDPHNGTPCYQCIFEKEPAAGLAPSCAEAGVIGPLPGVIGSMMAVEAIKALAGAGQGLRGEMLIYDALYSETRKITLKPRETCPICASARQGA